jgi:hypothetical protein
VVARLASSSGGFAATVAPMPAAGPDAPPSLVPTILGLAAAALLWVGCFDSDEKVRLAMPTGGSTSTGIFDPSTSTGFITGASTDTGDATCRDAVECALECAGELQQMVFNDVPEPALGCFVDCADTINTQEVLTLLRLTECAANVCADPTQFASGVAACDFTPGGTTGGSSSSSGGSSSSSGGSSSTGGSSGSSTGGDSTSTGGGMPEPLIDPCLECIIAFVQDEDAEECAEYAMACQ